MKKSLKLASTLIIASALTILTAQTAWANFTVLPSEPFEKQFNFKLNPGQAVTAAVDIRNLKDDPLYVKVYGADATISNQGTFAVTSEKDEQLHIGQWIKLKEPFYTIPGKATEKITFSINIPENATPGDFSGAIAVESLAAPPDQKSEENIVVTSRIAVKTFVNIPGEKITNYDWTYFFFSNKTAEKHSSFNYGFTNSGNTIVFADPKITLHGFPLLEKGTFTLPSASLQPQKNPIHLEKRWADGPSWGFYRATGTVTFHEFDIENNKTINETTITKTIWINLIPLPVTIFLILLAISLTVCCTLRELNWRTLKKTCIPYKVKPGDNLKTIAEHYKISWRKLAKLNKFKKPYSISENQDICVPEKYLKTNRKTKNKPDSKSSETNLAEKSE